MREKFTTSASAVRCFVKTIGGAARKQPIQLKRRSGLCWTAYAASRVLPSYASGRVARRGFIKQLVEGVPGSRQAPAWQATRRDLRRRAAR